MTYIYVTLAGGVKRRRAKFPTFSGPRNVNKHEQQYDYLNTIIKSTDTLEM